MAISSLPCPIPSSPGSRPLFRQRLHQSLRNRPVIRSEMARAGGIASPFLHLPYSGVAGRPAPNIQIQAAGIHHKRTRKLVVEWNRVLPGEELADRIEIGLASILGSLRSACRVSEGS